MIRILEQLVIALWNRLQGRRTRPANDTAGALTLGFRVAEGQVTNRRVSLSPARRTMHVALFGKTGSGKSSSLKYACLQDIRAGRGCFFLDLHGDATPFLLSAIAAEEWRRREHLSDRVIVISPSDPEMSVGLNPLESIGSDFIRSAEFSEILKQRYNLDYLGARTDELLRNALFVLSANGLTLLELGPLLSDAPFRSTCLARTPNAEVRVYFEDRFGQVSEPMKATMREPILNKTSAFTADPRFRHIVGQTQSTFSMKDAMDRNCIVIAHLPKGELGSQALTFASLLFTVVKNAIFMRSRRTLFPVYLDEMQNLVAQSTDVETVLSEARKFGVGIIAATQFIDQYPASMRSAILSVASHLCFQLSSADAATVAQMFDGGKSLAEQLKNLPQRHFILKSGADHWVEGCVPRVEEPETNYTELLRRSRARYARQRAEIERDIAERHATLTNTTHETLHDWN